MKTRVIQDDALIEMTRRQIDTISSISERLKSPSFDMDCNEMGKRLESFVIGLRRAIDLLETRIVRAR